MEQDLCKEIDKVLYELLHSYGEYNNMRDLLNKQTKEGSFKIAKARVALLPTGRITQDQYSKEMCATAVIEEEYDMTCETLTISDVLDPVLKKIPLCIKDSPIVTKTDKDDIWKILSQPAPVPANKTQLTNTKQGVKVILKKPMEQPEEKQQEAKEKEPKVTKSNPEMKNPLYWFGYFPPQNLVQAQNHYSEVLMAKEKRRLDMLFGQFSDLMEKKRELGGS